MMNTSFFKDLSVVELTLQENDATVEGGKYFDARVGVAVNCTCSSGFDACPLEMSLTFVVACVKLYYYFSFYHLTGLFELQL